MTQNKTTTGLVAVVLTAFLAGTSQAAFTSVNKVAKKAVARLTSAGTITLNSVTVKTIATNSTVTDVAWTNPQIGSWALADDYLVLDATSSATGSGIQIWTDNVNGVAPDKSTLTAAERVTVTPAGLVDESNPKKSIPLAWAVKPVLTPSLTAVDPNAGTAFPDSFSWHYVADKGSLNNPATTADEGYHDAGTASSADYQIVQNTAGIHTGQAATEYFPAANPKVIYLEGNFVSAATPDTYGTTTLTIEAYQD